MLTPVAVPRLASAACRLRVTSHALSGGGLCCADMVAMIGEYQQLSREDALHLVIECMASVVRAGRDACAAWAWPAASALLKAWVIDPTDQARPCTPL